MRGLFRKSTSWLLIFALIIGMMPALVLPTIAASNMVNGFEGQEADIFSALGFDTSKMPEGYDAETTDNPYGRDTILGNQVFEALVASSGGTTSYGKDNNSVSGRSISGMPSSGAQIGMAMYAVATGDFDGDGLPGEVVYVGYDKIYYNDFQTKANLQLQVYDAKTGSISDTKNIGSFNPAQVTTSGGRLYSQYDYAWQNLLQVTAGDYDCDGISEIAVYVADDGNCRVDIYKYQKTSQSPANGWLTIGNWTRVWTYVVTNTGNKMYNMVSLVSGDFNRDGIDDLGLSYGRLAPYGDSSKGIFTSVEVDKSQAAILWGAKSDMLQSIYKLNLNEAELGEQTRVSLTAGDLDGDGNKELIATGQPITDVVSHFNSGTSNTTRSIITYLYDATLGMTINTSGLYKPVDGQFVSQEVDGNTTTGWQSGNGFDENYNSQPLMRTNAAAFKPQGHDYAYLYLDSCLYEYMQGQITLKISLDDTNYDGSQTLGEDGTWGVDRIDSTVSTYEALGFWSFGLAFSDGKKNDYVEYGAIAADINGNGYDTLMTNFYRSNSKNDGAGKHFATYATLYADNDGRLNTAHSGSKSTYSQNDTELYHVYSDDTLSTTALAMVDIDLDTVIIEYTGLHYLTYSDPKVLAIIAAAPYFEDVDVISDYDYAWQNTTTYSFMVGEGHADLHAVDFEGGFYISTEKEVGGGKIELETSLNATVEWEMEHTKTTEYTMTFETSQDEDSVVFFSTPTEHYVYRFKVPDGKGGYTETIDTISNTFTPAYQVLTLDYYESIQSNYTTLPSIKGEALTSTPGDPSSYPASTSGYNVIAQWNSDPAGVSFGNGAITQEVTITEEDSESINAGVTWDFQFGGGVGLQSDVLQSEVDTTGGIQWSLNPTWGTTELNLTGSSFSGTVTNMPLEFQDYGYYYNWKLFAYNYKFSDGTSVPVVSYVVGDISQPPELPDDFQQDYDRSTSEKNVLTWTYDDTFSSFYIYKYYDFPVGGGLQLVEEVPSSTANYSVKYNAEGKPYKEYYFEDENLAAYTEYQYAIQVERLSEVPPLSAPSGLLTARTKAAEGYPSMILAESDNENDGKLQVYPDKNSYLTANVTGPEGEAPNAYYTTVQYQWQKQEKGAWTDIENETNMTLTFANAGSDSAGTYRCRVNVLTKSDATAITAYTEPVTLTHAFRSSYVEEVYVKDVTGGGVELYAKIANGHADSASIPGGMVIFNLTNNATGKNYQRSVTLNAAGIANIVLDDMLDEGMYTVYLYYYGTTIFKSCSDQTLYLSQRDSGYDIDAPASVTYGDGTQIIHRMVTKNQGMSITQETKAGEYALIKGDPLSIKAPYRSLIQQFLYPTKKTTDGGFVDAGRYYYITIDTVNYYFTASRSGTITVDGMYVTYGDASSYLTYTNDGGKYDLAQNTPAGNYVVKMTTEGETTQTALIVEKRPVTLQLPKQKGAEGIDAPIIKLGDLQMLSGSWADCDMPDGLLHADLADLSLNLNYINTAGSDFDRQGVDALCGYYIIRDKGANTSDYANYAITLLDGSITVIGAPQNVQIGARPFEGQQVGTVYAVSPEYAYTRLDIQNTGALVQGHATGTRLVFTAVPDEGYEIYDWYINGVAQGTKATSLAYVLLAENTRIEVQFAIKQNTLIFGTAGDEGGGSIICSDPNLTSDSVVLANALFSFTAKANPGYHFKEWRYTELGKGTAYDNSDNGKMESSFDLLMPTISCSLYAVFERDFYTFEYADRSGANGLTAWYMGSTTGDSTAALEKIYITSGDLVKGDTLITVEPASGYRLNTEYAFVSTGSQGTSDYDAGKYTVTLTEDSTVTGWTEQMFFDLTLNFDVETTMTFPAGTQMTYTIDGELYTFPYSASNPTLKLEDLPGGSEISVQITHPGYYNLVGWTNGSTVTTATDVQNKAAICVGLGDAVEAGVAYWYSEAGTGSTRSWYFIAPATGTLSFDAEAVTVYASGLTFELGELGKDETATVHLKEKPVYTVTIEDITGYGTYSITLPEGAEQTTGSDNSSVVRVHDGDTLTTLVTPSQKWTVSYWQAKRDSMSEPIKVRATSLKYAIENIQENYAFTPIFSSTTYNTITWSTISSTKNGLTLSPEAGYLSSVSAGSQFKFTLSGTGLELLDQVLANGNPFVPAGSENAGDYTYENGVYTISGIQENQVITVSMKNTGITVNGVDIVNMTGTGWSYDHPSKVLTITRSGLTIGGTPNIGSLNNLTVWTSAEAGTLSINNLNLNSQADTLFTFTGETMILSLAGHNTLKVISTLIDAQGLVIRGNGSLDVRYNLTTGSIITTKGDLSITGHATVDLKSSSYSSVIDAAGSMQIGAEKSSASPTVRIQQYAGYASTAINVNTLTTWGGELLISATQHAIGASEIKTHGGIMELNAGSQAIINADGNWRIYYPNGYMLRYATTYGAEPSAITSFAHQYSHSNHHVLQGTSGTKLDYAYVRISPVGSKNSTGLNILTVTYDGKQYSTELSGEQYKYYYIDLDDKNSTTLKSFTHHGMRFPYTSTTGSENWLIVARYEMSPTQVLLETATVSWYLDYTSNLYELSTNSWNAPMLDYKLSGGDSNTISNIVRTGSGLNRLTLDHLTSGRVYVSETPVYLVGDNYLSCTFDTPLYTDGDLYLYSDGTGTLTLNSSVSSNVEGIPPSSALDATNLHLHNVKALTMYSGASAITAGSNANIYFYDGNDSLIYGQGWKIDQGGNATNATTLSSAAVDSTNYLKIYGATTDGSVTPQTIVYDKSDITNLNKTLSLTYAADVGKLLSLVETTENGVTYVTLKLIDSEGNETKLKLIKGDAIADGYSGFYTANSAGATLTLAMDAAILKDLDTGEYTVRIPTENAGSFDAVLKITYSKTSTGGLYLNPSTVTLGRGQSVTFTSSYTGTTPSIYKWFVNGAEIDHTGTTYTFTVPADATIGTPITVTVKSYNGDQELGSASSSISVSATVQSIDITCEQETPSGDGSYTLYNTTDDGIARSWSFHSAVTMDGGSADMSKLSWSLWGNNLRATTIDSVTGVLTVSPKETGTNGKLQLIATYAHDDGTTFVKVIDIYLSTDVWVEADNSNAVNGQIGSVTFGNDDVTAGGYVPQDATVTVTAQPAESYTVKTWFVNGQSVMGDPNYTVDMVNKTLTFTAGLNVSSVISAEYINLGMVIVDFTAEGPGTVTAVSGEESLEPGAEIRAESSATFTAVPTEFCVIKAWYVNGELLEGYTESTLTLDMLMENVSVSVEFEAPERIVNVTTSEGGSLKATLNGQLQAGNSFTITTLDTLILEAIPADGYRVKVWTMNKESIQSNSCVIMPGTADVDVLVAFEKIPGYTVTVYTNSYENGTGQVISGETVIGMASSGTIAVGENQNLTLTAQPDVGCYLYGWTVNGTTYAANGNTLTLFNVSDDVVVTAKFRRSFYDVTLSAGEGGTIVGTYALTVLDNHYNGVVSVGESIRGGSAISLIITPDAGNRPASFTINGESVKLAQDVYTNIYTLTLDALVTDLQIEVTFETPEIFEVIIPNQFTEVKLPEEDDTTVEPDEPALIDDTAEPDDTVEPNDPDVPVEPAEPIEQVTGQVTLEYIRDGLSTDGELTDTTQSANIAEGGAVILSFIPAEGYELNQASIEEQLKAILGEEGYAAKVSLHLTSNGYQIRIVGIDQNLDLTSIENPFREKPEIPSYTITIPEIENGTLTVLIGNAVMENGAIVPEGTELTLIVEADDHYKLILLQVNGVDCDGTFTVTEDMVIDAQFEMAHCYENVVVTQPTCTEGGYTTHTCIYCDDSYVDAHTEPLDHSFTNYVSDNNATDTADGTKTAKCDRCDVTNTIIDEGSMLSLPTTITSDIFAVDEGDIHKITSGTTASELIEGINEKAYIKVYSGDQEVSGDTLIGTGMVVKLIIAGQVRDAVTVVVTGDINGDGKITATDVLVMKSYLLQMSTLEGAYATAADLNGDGNVSVTDFVQIKAHILEKGSITAR